MPSGATVPSPATAMDARAPARATAEADLFDNGWLADGELVDAAYGETMAAMDIQTSLPPQPPAPPPAPEWLIDLLRGIGQFFEWSAPALRWVLWILAAMLILFLLYRLVPGFAAWVDRWRQRAAPQADEAAGQIEAAAAHARLADADALARAGRFAEAVHLLLYRSVDDIAARRPGLVKPALTSRDLAASADLPRMARTAFAGIARAVEISLFGGRNIDAGVWAECRAAYADLTVPHNWTDA